MEKRFEHQRPGKRLRTMLAVDFRRMFTMPLIYIMVGACLVMPILILVMTTMMDGSTTTNPQTGEVTVIEGFDNTWQIIGTLSATDTPADSDTSVTPDAQTDAAEAAPAAAAAGMGMSMTDMCNINLLYFFMAVLVCIFTADDFRAGYAKNLFTVRAAKGDYVVSKTLVCVTGGALMLIAFLIGTLLGGAISGLPFELGAAGVSGLVMCMIAKVLLTAVFVPIYLLWSVFAKQKLWLSLVGSFAVSMLLFMMVPMLTPLNSTVMNVVLCLAGGVMFSVGLGFASTAVMKKRDIL